MSRIKTELEDAYIEGFDTAIRILRRAHPGCDDDGCEVCAMLREFVCDCDDCLDARGSFDISSFN